jgi:hypothetical protein
MPPRNRRSLNWRVLISILVSLCLGALVGLAIGRITGGPELSRGVRLGVLLALPFIVVLAVLVHELGHVFAGLLGGMRFLFMAVGPVMLSREGDALHWRRSRNLAFWGGFTVMVPVAEDGFRRRLGLMTAGGPLASLLLAAVGAATAAWAAAERPVLAACGWATALISGSLFLVSGIPLPVTQGMANDGSQLLSLMRDGNEALLRATLGRLTALSVSGTRPRDLDPADIAELERRSGGTPLAIAGTLYAFAHAVDRRDPEAAARSAGQLAAQWEEASPIAKPMIAWELAWYHAAVAGDVATAREWLGRAEGMVLLKQQALRARAAVALVEGRVEEARALAREALPLAERSWDRGSAAAEREWLEGVVSREA